MLNYNLHDLEADVENIIGKIPKMPFNSVSITHDGSLRVSDTYYNALEAEALVIALAKFYIPNLLKA